MHKPKINRKFNDLDNVYKSLKGLANIFKTIAVILSLYSHVLKHTQKQIVEDLPAYPLLNQ